MSNSKIPWLKNPDGTPGKTWPLAEGCIKMSAGCQNCCAERTYHRWHPDGDFRKVRLKPEHLEDPLHWVKPQRVLVDFMFDLFHKKIVEMNESFLDEIFAIMAASPQHTYIALTKRPVMMFHYLINKRRDLYVEHALENIYGEHGWCSPEFEWPLPNLWLGVSVEDQKTFDDRWSWLKETPATRRIISYEPALGPIDFINSFMPEGCDWDEVNEIEDIADDHEPEEFIEECEAELDWINYGHNLVVNPEYLEHQQWRENWARAFAFHRQVDGVFMGCESGPGARPMDIAWAEDAQYQCELGEVPFFFKQAMKDGKLIHMPELYGRVWDQVPEMEMYLKGEKKTCPS